MKKTGLFNCGILWMFVSLLVSMNASWAEDALTPTEMSVPTYGTVWEPKAARDSIEAFANDAKDKATVQEKEKSLENKSLGASVSERFSGFFAGEITNDSTSITMLTCIADEKLDGNISYPSTGRAGTFSGGTNDALWKAKWDGGGSFLLAPGRLYSVTGTYLNNCYLGTDTVADVDGCSIYQVKTDNKYGLKDFQIFNPTGGTGGSGAWQALGSAPVNIFNGSTLSVRVGKTLDIEWPVHQPLLKMDGNAASGTALGTTKANDEYAVSPITFSGTDGLHDLSVECCGEKLTGKIRLVSLEKGEYRGSSEGSTTDKELYYKADGGGVDNTVLLNDGYDFRVTFKAEAGVTTSTLNPIGLRSTVYRYWSWNNPIQPATGKEAPKVSCSTVENYVVSFYIDENGDGVEGVESLGKDQETGVKSFAIQSARLKERKFTVKYADSLTSSSTDIDGTVDGWLNTANGLLQARTHQDDYRTLVELQRKDGATTYAVTATVPGKISVYPDDCNALRDAKLGANIIIVNSFDPSTNAAGAGYKNENVLVIPTTLACTQDCAHEIGHSIAGLDDWGRATCSNDGCKTIDNTKPFNRNLLMYHSGDRRKGEYLLKEEAAAFQK